MISLTNIIFQFGILSSLSILLTAVPCQTALVTCSLLLWLLIGNNFSRSISLRIRFDILFHISFVLRNRLLWLLCLSILQIIFGKFSIERVWCRFLWHIVVIIIKWLRELIFCLGVWSILRCFLINLRSHISFCIRITESITSLIYDRSLIWYLTVWWSLLIRIFIVTIIFSSIFSLRSCIFNFLFLIFNEIGGATFLWVTFRWIL